MDHPRSGLKYVDADDLEDDRIDFDGLNVESPTGEHLGDVEGFVVDASDARPYYIVVDAGGWFKSKEFLLPIGHARLDEQREVIVVDLTRDRIDSFPGFDRDEFETFTDDGIRQFNDATSAAVSGGMQQYTAADHFSSAWNRPEFRFPDWWHAEPTLPSRMGSRGLTAGAEYSREPTMADLTKPVDRSGSEMSGDRTAARDTDPSPHHDGRAQPGDVLGLETGGESSHIGDTAEDENERRRDAERHGTKLTD